MAARNVLLALAMLILSTATGFSQVTVDVSKITCEQFVRAKIAHPRVLATWLSGYYHGKSGSALVDPQAFEVKLSRLTRECDANLSTPVMQILEKSISARK